MGQRERIAELEAALGALLGTLEHYPRTNEIQVITALAVAAKVLGKRKAEQATGRPLIEVLAELELD